MTDKTSGRLPLSGTDAVHSKSSGPKKIEMTECDITEQSGCRAQNS